MMTKTRNELREKALTQGRSTEQIAPPVPTPETDAAPPGDTSTRFIFLAGAIKYWWLAKCISCSRLYDKPTMCNHAGTEWEGCMHQLARPLWDSPEHRIYLKWRRDLRAALIAEGFLTYAPHEAFKGRWDERAQAVNDAGIAACDAMIVMSKPEWPSDGTDDEVKYAHKVGTRVMYLPPPDSDSEEVWNVGLAVAFVKALLQAP